MDDSPYGLAALWAQSDGIIKAVAATLLLMSIAAWTVIVTRGVRVLRLQRAVRSAEAFWHTRSFAEGLAQLESAGSDNPFLVLATEAHAAVDHHRANTSELHGQISLADWLTESLRGTIDESTLRLQAGMAVLASVGSTAPFVGLFGTVWGIYHALVSIGRAGQASIEQMAGPVGEALIMTAFGLAVAIPAVLGYNALTRANKLTNHGLHRFARQLHAFFLTGAPVAEPERSVGVTPLRPVVGAR